MQGRGSTLPWDMAELELLARSHLTHEAAVYYETTATYPPSRENERAWQSWRFVPRFGIDVSEVTTAIDLVGTPVAAPILLAPCAFAGYADPDGEWAIARAAASGNVIYVVSSASSKSPESVPGAAAARCWFQLYVPAERDEAVRSVRRAEEAGFEAIVVTVDAPIGSMRHVGFVPYSSTDDPFTFGRPGGSPLNSKVTWATVEEVARLTSLPLLVKGVLHPADARLAIEHGARGVIVSNHGGRQLDGVVPTALVVEEIAEAIASRAGDAVVLVDGGIRSGRDVLRALCLGARGALVGRPYLWALAVAGEAGVDLLIRRLILELENALALTGCRSVEDANRELLRWHEAS